MSYCAVPDTTAAFTRPVLPSGFVVDPPSETGEVCDTSVTEAVTTPASTTPSTSTTTMGPPGPVGPMGPTGPSAGGGTTTQHAGLRFAGTWTEASIYYSNDSTIPRHADSVSIDNAFFVCIENHTASALNRPQLSTFDGPTEWPTYWVMVVEPSTAGTGTVTPEQATFVDKLYNGIYDWMKKATVGDWVAAAIAGIGLAIAGAIILDAFLDDGSETGEGADPDSRYNGSPTFVGTYVPPSIRTVVASLCVEAGISNYDVSLLPDDKYCHFSLAQSTSIRTILDNMSRAFQFDMVDSSGTLKFIPRNNIVVRTLSYDDMAFNSTNETVAPVTIKRLQSVDLPRSVSLTYIAEDLDYNNYSQKTEIPTFADGNDVNLSVPFMLSHADAKEATEKLVIGSHLERMQFTFKTSYKNAIDLEPGDVISIPDGFVRIVQIEEAEEGILEIHCVDAGAVGAPQPIVVGGVTIGYTASTYEGTGQAPQMPVEPINIAPVITKAGVLFIDPPVLNSLDTTPRVYAAIHGYGVEGWPGAQLFRSVDGGASYTLLGSTNTSAKWGLVGTAIGSASQYVWDDTTVITVQMKTGSLVSKTDAAVLAGENLCMIGSEVIAFGTATLTAPGTYQLTHLLRGRQGTEWAIAGHVSNELFVMLDTGIVQVSVPDTDRGKVFKYKVVTYGSDLTKAEAQDIQIIGNNTIPWTASQVGATRNTTSNAWTVEWVERPRYVNALSDYFELQHDYDFGGYLVEIMNGSTMVRQTIVYDPFFEYTSAMQISDFGVVQSTLSFKVFQISNKYGGGRPISVNT